MTVALGSHDKTAGGGGEPALPDLASLGSTTRTKRAGVVPSPAATSGLGYSAQRTCGHLLASNDGRHRHGCRRRWLRP